MNMNVIEKESVDMGLELLHKIATELQRSNDIKEYEIEQKIKAENNKMPTSARNHVLVSIPLQNGKTLEVAKVGAETLAIAVANEELYQDICSIEYEPDARSLHGDGECKIRIYSPVEDIYSGKVISVKDVCRQEKPTTDEKGGIVWRIQ